MPDDAYIVGVGCTKFERPESKKWDYPDMAREAGLAALLDAGLEYRDVLAVVASYCYGEPASGQRAAYELGLTGVPVFNVNNNCSSGSTALMLARHLIQSGQYGCVMALGFEKMERGLSERFTDKASPVQRHFDRMYELGMPKQPLKGMNKVTSEVVRLYAYAAREYLDMWGDNVSKRDFAHIAVKNRFHGLQNPKACFYGRGELPLEKALSNRTICDPITIHQSSLTADGAACAVLCSPGFVKRRYQSNHYRRFVKIVGQQMCTDLITSFNRDATYMSLSGYEMAKNAAHACYSEAGKSPMDIDVVEVHDCFAPNELFMYEALRLAPEGKGGALLKQGRWVDNSAGGKVYKCGHWVINPSGGLESKGHPIGATGLAQCHEIVTQLRGEALKRQVPGARMGLQHNFGIGGAAVVTMYEAVGQPGAKL